MSQTTPSSPTAVQKSHKPAEYGRHFLTAIGILLGMAGVLLTLLQFTGVSHIGLLSHVIHPGADQILQNARNATYHDMSCIHTEVYLNRPGTWPGVCTFTSNPERAEFRFDIQNPPTDSFYMLFDVTSTAVYAKDPNHPNWVKGPPDCQTGMPCPPAFLASLPSLYDVTDPQFVGVDSIHNIDTYHIRGNLQSPMLSSPAVEDIWLAQDDYYPMRLVVHDATIAGANIPPATYTLYFTGYNQGVTITLPTTYQNQP